MNTNLGKKLSNQLDLSAISSNPSLRNLNSSNDSNNNYIPNSNYSSHTSMTHLTSSPVTFNSLCVSEWLESIASRLQIFNPTLVQQLALPHVYKGENLLCISETGSGKTLCYCWPMLEHLSVDPYGIFGIVLLPSRELAEQVAEQFAIFGSPMSLSMCLCVGGHDITKQSLEIAAGPHVIIATPGRLAYYINNKSSGIHRKLKHLRMLVLDEADALLQGNIENDLLTILQALPSHESKQTLFFTATLTEKLHMIATTSFTLENVHNNNNLLLCEDSDKNIDYNKLSLDNISHPSKDFIETQLSSTNVDIQKIQLQKPRLQIVNTGGYLTDDGFFNEEFIKKFVSPERLIQSYLFIPKHVHYVYLHHILSNLLGFNHTESDNTNEITSSNFSKKNKINKSSVSSINQSKLNIPILKKNSLLKKLSPTQKKILSSELEDSKISSGEIMTSGIIFVGKCYDCDYINMLLTLLGYSVVSLHSGLTQRRRRASLMKFRSGLCTVLVATDVASRGLDLPKVDFVINLNFPRTPEVYVHRVGRTARAGRKGLAISFVTQHDSKYVQDVEQAIHHQLVNYEDYFDELEALKLMNKVTRYQHQTLLILEELNIFPKKKISEKSSST